MIDNKTTITVVNLPSYMTCHCPHCGSEIKITYSDFLGMMSEYYYVDWTGDSEYTNNAQKTYLSKEGNLYIVIAEGADIEDFYDLEEIENEDYMDFHFDMCDVGN